MSASSIMAIFSALALGHCLFLVGHFWSSVKKDPNRFFLALLLSALAIRIIKSVLTVLIPNIPEMIPAIGLVGLTAIGPSFWFYVQSFKKGDYKVGKVQIRHFIPVVLLAALIPLFNDPQMYIAYCISVAHMLVYLLFSASFLFKRTYRYKRVERQWLWMLTGSVLILWFTFFAQLLIESFMTYLLVTIVAAVVLYGLSLWGSNKRRLFINGSRRNVAQLPAETEELGRELERLFSEKKIYTNATLSIKELSVQLEQPEYFTSMLINRYFKKSFPEVLNHYRIEHAIALIDSEAYKNLSIEGIAYESGYRSISAFYRAFKKLKGVTPARFKNGS